MNDDDQTQPHDDTTPDPAAGDDIAFARLRAADPAGGPSADLAPVYASVTAATGVTVTEETILVDELAARRARRVPGWLQAAAIVAGIAVIGGGSYALGGAHAATPPAAAPPMSLDQGRGAASVASGVAPGAEGSLGASADSKIAGWGFGRTVFSSDGLSTDGGHGAAYGFDAVATYTQATIERVAAALGVTGTPQDQNGQWVVGPNDGSGPTVSISPDGLTSLSYYDPSRDPWSCIKGHADPPNEGDDSTSSGTSTGVVGSAGAPGIAPDVCQTSTDPAPVGDAAVRQAKDTMSALGVDPSGFEFEPLTDPSNAQLTTVSAYQVVDGQRTGLSWNFSIVASGVQSVYGGLAPTVALGDYSVVSPKEAVARLSDPRFGQSYGGIMPMAAQGMKAGGGMATDMASAMASAPALSDSPTVPATPAPGSPLAWPVQHVTIVSARLGLAVTTLPDGASVLAPTYELTDADGTAWTVIAVADEDLDFSS